MTSSALHPSATPANPDQPFQGEETRIGIFDSGLGGLSVLRAIRERLPRADLLYVADSAHAPYGERASDYVAQRSQEIGEFLRQKGVDAIVVACNTATAAAVHLLRAAHPGLPIIGVEPGVKPAVMRSRRGRVGVLATPSTLASDKYRRLIEAHGRGATIVAQPCPGLAKEIEQGLVDTPALRELVHTFAAPLRAQDVDTVVLGCTHYTFVAPLFQAALGPDVDIVDTAVSVADHTARRCALVKAPAAHLPSHLTAQDRPSQAELGRVQLFSSGDPRHLADVYARWLGTPAEAAPLA